MNVVVLKGRLTKDPELATTQSGKDYTRFTVAVDKWGEGVDFIPCTAWGKIATTITTHLTKGREICVQGSLNTNKYTDKDGNNRVSYEVNVNNFDFCGSKNDTPGVQNKTPSNNNINVTVDDDVIEIKDGEIELPF